MKTYTWIFAGQKGKNSKLVLKHGLKSGNLALFCNGQLLLVEYDVFDECTFSFFIDEELCRIQITKNKKGFHYQFEIDEDVDTPLNRFRKQAAKEDRRKSILFISSFIGVFVIILAGAYLWNQYKVSQDIQVNGRVAKVLVHFQKGGDSWNGHFTYYFRGAYYEEEVPSNLLDQKSTRAESRELFVRFSRRHPERFKLMIDQPTLAQLKRDRQNLLKKCTVQLAESECSCILNESYKQEGPKAWQKLKGFEGNWQSLKKQLNTFCEMLE